MNLRVFYLTRRGLSDGYLITMAGEPAMSAFENNTTPACSSAITLLGHAD